jgi:hypothetical protein
MKLWLPVSIINILQEYAKLLGIPVEAKEKKEYYTATIAKAITTDPSIVQPAITKDGM